MILYNLGNFVTGKTIVVNNKDLLAKYIAMGYKLISTVWTMKK